jgi:methionine-rich copper-binding protein CopC
MATVAGLLLTQPASAFIETRAAGLMDSRANPETVSRGEFIRPDSVSPHRANEFGANEFAPTFIVDAKTPFELRKDARFPLRLAHAILVKAFPEKDAVVSDAPEELLLIFNEGVGQEFLALAVIDETGKRVDQRDAKLDFTDRSHLRASVAKLAPGKYTVRYRVLSADGHVVSGKYFFHVQAK